MTLQGKVLVTGESVAPRFLRQLEESGLTVINPATSFPPAVLSSAELVSELRGCRAYLLGGDEIASRDVLGQTSGLELVSFLGVGYQSFVDADAAASLGIPVSNTPGVLSNSVAEFTIGLLLEARRNIVAFATESDVEHRKESDLAGHHVGIVGLGAIGTRLAEILREGFRAKVSYFSRTRKEAEESRLGIAYLPLAELVSEVEALIVMVPETPETKNLIGADLLSRRSPEAPLTIINTARAEVIEPTALSAAVSSGAVDRVRFDGYYRDDTESAEALLRLPGVRVTPHVASLTHDARDAMSELAVEAILNVLSGRPHEHIVNPTYAAHAEA